jgi:hypothetical protein
MSPTSGKKLQKSDKKKNLTKDVVSNKKGKCVHHWSIEPPNGTISIGRCKICGDTREFRNSFEYSSWYGSKSPQDLDSESSDKSSG